MALFVPKLEKKLGNSLGETRKSRKKESMCTATVEEAEEKESARRKAITLNITYREKRFISNKEDLMKVRNW